MPSLVAVLIVAALAILAPSPSRALSQDAAAELMAFPAGPEVAADQYKRELPFARPLSVRAVVEGDTLALTTPATTLDIAVPLVDLANPGYESVAVNLDLTVAEAGSVSITAFDETVSFDATAGRGSYRVALTATQLDALEKSVKGASPATQLSLTIDAPANITHLGRGTHVELRALRVSPKVTGVPENAYVVGSAPLGHDIVPMKIDGLHINQGAQDTTGTVPTVVHRNGVLRLLATRTDQQAVIEDVTATVTINYPDGTVRTEELTGPNKVPFRSDQRFRTKTWDLALGNLAIRPNMAIRVEMEMTYNGTRHTLRYPQHDDYEFVTVTMPVPTITQIPLVVEGKADPVLDLDPYSSRKYSAQPYKWHPFPGVHLEAREDLVKTQEELNELYPDAKVGYTRVYWARAQKDLWSREEMRFVYTIANTSVGWAFMNHVVGTAGTNGRAFGHEIGHNLGLAHDNDYYGCPWRDSVAYDVVNDKIEGEMWPTKLHRSFMANGECADASLRYVDGSTDKAFYWATIGTQQNAIRRYGDFDTTTTQIGGTEGDVDCSGDIGIADPLFLVQGLDGDRTSSPTCPINGRGYATRQCNANADHACNRDDVISLLENIIADG